MTKHGEEFQREAVRIALTSGLPRKRIAADLGVGLSTLTRCGSWRQSAGFWMSAPAATAPGVSARLAGARTGMRVLAHIREQYSLSLGSYGRLA